LKQIAGLLDRHRQELRRRNLGGLAPLMPNFRELVVFLLIVLPIACVVAWFGFQYLAVIMR